MSLTLPLVTVIIAAPPDLAVVTALAAVRRLDYPAERLEILVARGRQPSAQRNAALRAARGEWVYFLDDDALPFPGNLRRAAPVFSQPDAVMLGGPNLCPADAPWVEQVFAVVLASWLAFGPSRARYAPVGRRREAGEKELILCNTLARREPLLALGGFNEALYPNEENALMDALQQRGLRLVYDPEFAVHRRPRRNLRGFLRMLRTYGRGRAEQFRLQPTPGSALNFVPPLFCVYLALWLAVAAGPDRWIPLWLKGGATLPLALYLAAVLVQTGRSMASAGPARALAALPLLVASHLFYGLGFWHGCFTRLRAGGGRAATPVVLETLTL